MAKTILGHTVQQFTPEEAAAALDADVERTLRGIELYHRHGGDFVYRKGVWMIASDTVPGRVYEVNLEQQTCECADFVYRHTTCKHLVAGQVADSKSLTCSCCREKVLGRFTTEVTEDDGLLSWFVGDVLCRACIRAGFWV